MIENGSRKLFDTVQLYVGFKGFVQRLYTGHVHAVAAYL